MCHIHPFYPALRLRLLCHFPLWGWGAEEGRLSTPWRQELGLNWLDTYLVDRKTISLGSVTINIMDREAGHQEQEQRES